jgi:Na+/H+ antiporter NhaD/arsenite permease-like protein
MVVLVTVSAVAAHGQALDVGPVEHTPGEPLPPITTGLMVVGAITLMIPVAIDTALRLGVNPFAFMLAVTFAASTAFMTPMGYQTNLFVHGPGGYRFRDFMIVGGPLQILVGLTTTLGIAYGWPL